MQETRLDLRIQSEARKQEAQRTAKLVKALNDAQPYSEEMTQIQKELFHDIGKNSHISQPLFTNLAANIHIGDNVSIMPYFKCMAAGQIYIDDDVRIAMNVSIITNNHDPYKRDILLIKNVHIGKNAWIGAGATVLPGVTVGKNAIVGAASVVTKDIPDNCVAVGNPARVIKTLDANQFE